MADARLTDTGDTVYVAPERTKRPRGSQSGVCPFCPGNESMTPPTTEQVPAEGAWRARAFPNRYPITTEHEVVIDTTRHVLTFADLEPTESATAFGLYRSRAAALAARGLDYLLFRNEGPEAGGSIPHSHAQIVAEPDGFPRPRRVRGHEPGRVRVARTVDGFVAGVPEVGRFPYELWIQPVGADGDFHEQDPRQTDALGRLVLAASQAMAARVTSKGWNLVLHRRRGAWRLEMLARTEKFAGFELGGDVYVNAVDAETALAAWTKDLAPPV